MDLKQVKYEVNDAVARISINSPKTMNAINTPIINELYEAFQAAEADDSVKVIVLTGEGRAFCAGGDLSSMKADMDAGTIDLAAMMKCSAQLPLAMKKSAKPIIASVKGAAAGAGFSLALCCDFCFAAEGTQFMEAFVRVGLLPDTGGIYALARAVGDLKAAQLCMTGELIDAQTAKNLGIVYKVVPEEELDATVAKFAACLAKGPSNCYKSIKELEWEIGWTGYEKYLEKEIAAQVECGKSPNFKEGVEAFLEKRKANFR